MKTVLIAAALAASTAAGYDVHFTAGNTRTPTCAQRLIGKQLMGLGVVRVATTDPAATGKYLVKIEGARGQDGQASIVNMTLSADQLCDFAASVETAPATGR